MKSPILLLLFVLVAESRPLYRRQATTTPSSEQADEVTIGHPVIRMPTRTTIRLNHTREEAALICQRTSQILRNTRRSSRFPDQLNYEAISLARILTGNLTIGGGSDSGSQPLQPSQSSQNTQPTSSTFDPCDEIITVPGSNRKTKVKSIRDALSLRDRNYKETAIQKKYDWYRRQNLERYKKCIERGGTRQSLYRDIDEYTAGRVREHRMMGRPVHEYMIRHWASERAAAIGFNDFGCSARWLDFFKKRHNIRSKKVTKTVTAAQRRNQAMIDESREAFLRRFQETSERIPMRMIYNFDQSGVNYEITNQRTLSYIGERDVILNIESASDTTHSYTIQPIISRDGRLIGPLLICLRETNDLGPRIRPRIERLEREYGNIRVVWTKSGKMDKNQMQKWLRDILGPEITAQLRNNTRELSRVTSLVSRTRDPRYEPLDDVYVDQSTMDCQQDVLRRARDSLSCMQEARTSTTGPIAGPSWMDNPTTAEERDQLRRDRCYAEALQAADSACIDSPIALVIADSWPGQSNREIREFFRRNNIYYLQIPPGTTGEVQPLDVGFLRQYKILLKRIEEAALMDPRVQEQRRNEPEHRRYHVLNINSLVWNQLGAPVYRDMNRYAWRKTDSRYRETELELGSPPPTVNNVNFRFGNGLMCEVANCNHTAIVRCSHCGKLLCAKHFLDRVCIHNQEEDSETEIEMDESLEETELDYHEIMETVQADSSQSTIPYEHPEREFPHDELRAK